MVCTWVQRSRPFKVAIIVREATAASKLLLVLPVKKWLPIYNFSSKHYKSITYSTQNMANFSHDFLFHNFDRTEYRYFKYKINQQFPLYILRSKSQIQTIVRIEMVHVPACSWKLWSRGSKELEWMSSSKLLQCCLDLAGEEEECFKAGIQSSIEWI